MQDRERKIMVDTSIEHILHELKAIGTIIGSSNGDIPDHSTRLNIALFWEYTITERVELLQKKLGYDADDSDELPADTKKD